MMENFQEILELNKEDYEAYIDKKIATFDKCKNFCPTGSLTRMNKTNKFFWGEDSQIVTGYSPLVITDKEIFEYLFENIKEYFNKTPKNYKDFKKNLFTCVQKTVFDYLGVGRQLGGDEKRTEIYRTIFEMDKKTSIRCFKGNFYGACTERAVLAHECFKMLGFESVLATEPIYNDDKKELHAFNFVKIGGKTYLYDLINTYFIENAPMPRVVSCEVTSEKMIEKIFNDNTECDIFEFEKETKTQAGRVYIINYGLPEVEQSLS